MPDALLTAELRLAAPGIASRLGAILVPLAALLARAFLRNPRRVALIVPLCGYINRIARRFNRLAIGLAAGAGPRHSRPGRPGRTRAAAPRAPFPPAHGWLVADLRHEAVAYASQLAFLLAQPDAAALVAHCPRAASLLRPVCRMLGIRPPSLAMQRRARPPSVRPPAARPAPVRPPAAPAAPMPGAAIPAPHPAPPILPPRLIDPPCVCVRWPWFPRQSARIA